MKHVHELFAAVSARLAALTKRNAVVARPVSVGDRHLLTLCELKLGFGGGGGVGEGGDPGSGEGKGEGGGAGGGARATPVALATAEPFDGPSAARWAAHRIASCR